MPAAEEQRTSTKKHRVSDSNAGAIIPEVKLRDHGVQQAAADGPKETEAPALCSGGSHGVGGLDGVLLLEAGGRVFTPWAAATPAPEVDRAVDSAPGRAPVCGPNKQRQ